MVGPSFRYNKIFDGNYVFGNAKKKNILVLLPYFDREIKYIINLINGICNFDLPFHVKFHPGVSIFKYKKFFLVIFFKAVRTSLCSNVVQGSSPSNDIKP